MFPAVLTSLCFALTAVSARQSTALVGPIRANFYRLLIAILILGVLTSFTRQSLDTSLNFLFFIAGAVGFGLGGFCVMQSLKRLGAPLTLLVVESLTAIFAGGLAWIILKDGMSLSQILSCGIILAGVIVAGTSGWRKKDFQHLERKDYLQGFAFTAVASVFQAISLVISRHAFLLAKQEALEVSKFDAAFIRLIGGLGIAMALLAYQYLKMRKEKDKWVPFVNRGESLRHQPYIWASANALFGPVLGVTCWLWAVSVMNPGIVQSIAATSPLISIPVARLLESHRIGSQFYVGAVVAILGITALVLW